MSEPVDYDAVDFVKMFEAHTGPQNAHRIMILEEPTTMVQSYRTKACRYCDSSNLVGERCVSCGAPPVEGDVPSITMIPKLPWSEQVK